MHKYLYANVDPVNTIDPTGNFGIASFGVANNIRGILMDVQIEVGFSLLDGIFSGDSPGESNALYGIAALGGVASFKILKLLNSKFRKACNSFDEDTEVWTEFGNKLITDILIGDKVWAFNEQTGEFELQDVTHLIQRDGEYKLIEIKVGNDAVDATENHPFYVKGKDGWVWKEAVNLKVGDVVLDRNNKEQVITKINTRPHVGKVFNLTVDNVHTYLVGKNGVVAHNAGACKAITSFNMKHILSGDKFGGGHSIHGKNINIVEILTKNSNRSIKPYKARVKNSVTGEVRSKSFFPDSWGPSKIRGKVNEAYSIYISNGGKGKKFTQSVQDGSRRITLRIELDNGKNGLEVFTAHPVF